VFDLLCEFKSRFTMYPNPDSLIEYPIDQLMDLLVARELETAGMDDAVKCGCSVRQQHWRSVHQRTQNINECAFRRH